MKNLLLILLFPLLSASQNEAGVIGGGVAFLGDLGGNKGIGRTFIKDLQPGTIHPLVGAFYTIDFYDYSLGVQLLHGSLSGADSLAKHNGGAEEYRRVRGLYFSSPLTELTLFVKKDFGPFHGVVGGGAMYFHPTPIYQEKKYSLLQPLVSYGAGVTLPVSFHLSIAFDVQGRVLFTDYIDDVHERGHPANDSYVLAFLSLKYSLKNDFLSCPKRP